jgi:O-antigen/teichoic acid export membrane protein
MIKSFSIGKFKSTIVPLLSGVLSIGFVPITNLILLPLYTMQLSIEDFARYGLVMFYVSNITAIVNPGIMSVVRREFNNQDVESARLSFVIVYKYFLLAGLIVSGLGIGYIFLIERSSTIFQYLIFVPILSLSIQPVKLWQGYEASISIENVKRTARLSLGLIGLSVVITVPLLFTPADKVVARLFPIVFINSCLLIISIQRTKKLPWKSFDMVVAKRIWALSKKYAFAIFSSHMFIFFPIFYIENNLTFEDLGLYIFGLYLVNIPNILVEGLNYYWAPQYYRLKNLGVDYNIKTKLFVFILLIGGVYTVLCLIIPLLEPVNNNVKAILPIINILAFFAFVNSVIKVITPLLNYRIDYKFQSVLNFIAVLLLISISYVMSPNIHEFLLLLFSSKLLVLAGYIFRIKTYKN